MAFVVSGIRRQSRLIIQSPEWPSDLGLGIGYSVCLKTMPLPLALHWSLPQLTLAFFVNLFKRRLCSASLAIQFHSVRWLRAGEFYSMQLPLFSACANSLVCCSIKESFLVGVNSIALLFSLTSQSTRTAEAAQAAVHALRASSHGNLRSFSCLLLRRWGAFRKLLGFSA